MSVQEVLYRIGIIDGKIIIGNNGILDFQNIFLRPNDMYIIHESSDIFDIERIAFNG